MAPLQHDHALTAPISTSDQEMFHRVWDRVMASSDPKHPAAPLPVPAAAPPERGDDPPLQPDLPCLGSGSAQYARLLEQMLAGTHGLWQSYQTLARQSQGLAARQMRILSEEMQEQMRQLNAVFFLLTGRRYSPAPSAPMARQSLLHSLRALFMGEQHWQQIFLQAARDVQDPCLQPLFEELALQAQRHMTAIRRVLERL